MPQLHMRITLLALNSKFPHTNIAVNYISAGLDGLADVNVLDFNINMPRDDVLMGIFSSAPELIGVSCYIFNIDYVMSLLPDIKKLLPGVRIVLGGPEVFYDYDYLLPHCDHIIRFDGIDAMRKLARNEVMPKVIEGEPDDLAILPFPYGYIPPNRILYYESSRGCPHACTYCLSSVERGVRYKPLGKVFSDLDKFFAEEAVFTVKFVDRTFNADLKRANKILEYIADNNNGKQFHFEIDSAHIDDMFMSLAERLGSNILLEAGVQSLNLMTLDAINRKMADTVFGIARLAKNGIYVHSDLIAGLPFEDLSSFRASFNALFAACPAVIQLGFLKMLKGTPIRRDAELYNYKYSKTAPYEIFSNMWLSYSNICELKAVEEHVERLYNSGRFPCTVKYLQQFYKTPYDMFLSLASAGRVQAMSHINYLSMIIKSQASRADLLSDVLRYDYLAQFANPLPAFLRSDDYKAVKNTLECGFMIDPVTLKEGYVRYFFDRTKGSPIITRL